MDEYYPDVDSMYEDRWDFDCDFPYDECPYGDNGDSSEEDYSEAV